MPSQTDTILRALRNGQPLTPADALRAYGCFRLAARVNDARKLLEPGEVIVSERVTVSPGTVVARYRLERREPAQETLW